MTRDKIGVSLETTMTSNGTAVVSVSNYSGEEKTRRSRKKAVGGGSVDKDRIRGLSSYRLPFSVHSLLSWQ